MVEHCLKRDMTPCSFLKAAPFGFTVVVADLVDKEERLSFEKARGGHNCFDFRRVRYLTVMITNFTGFQFQIGLNGPSIAVQLAISWDLSLKH
jgi:hypothetical protein